MPTKAEENNRLIQYRNDALGRGDTDALFASMHKDPSQVRALIKEPTTKESIAKPPAKEVSSDGRNDRGRATFHDRLGKRFKRTLFGIGLVLILAVGGLYFFAQTARYESTDDAFVDGHTH